MDAISSLNFEPGIAGLSSNQASLRGCRSGHLRATMNGVAVPPRQLDQAKVPTVGFRAEHATVDTRQRLKVRKLFQNAGVACKLNEGSEAAVRMLKQLGDLAHDAGVVAGSPHARRLVDPQRGKAP